MSFTCDERKFHSQFMSVSRVGWWWRRRTEFRCLDCHALLYESWRVKVKVRWVDEETPA